MTRPWNQTLGHHVYEYETPDLSAINLPDIAHSLALINRFNGHTTRPLSVAEHSLGVAAMVEPEYRLGALLHDAAEAYVGDMSAPLKKLCPGYMEIEQKAHAAISERFGVCLDAPEIKQADLDALITECEVLKGGQTKDWGVDGTYRAAYADRITLYENKPWTWHRDTWWREVGRAIRLRAST